MNRWSFSPSPPWTRLLIRNPAKQVRPAAPFLPVFSSWSTRSSAPGFPPGHRLIRGLTRDTRGIYSAERRREDGNRERWETARISPPGCGEAYIFRPPPPANPLSPFACRSRRARGRRRRVGDGKFRSARRNFTCCEPAPSYAQLLTF